jgi:RNase P/RNase MRP subunit p29
MKWPDIFFKARPARTPEKSPAKGSELLGAAGEVKPEEAVTAETPAAEDSADASGRLPVSQVTLPPAPIHSGSSDRSVVREMAEADTLRQMTRSGGIRLVKRNFNFPAQPGRSTRSIPGFMPKTETASTAAPAATPVEPTIAPATAPTPAPTEGVAPEEAGVPSPAQAAPVGGKTTTFGSGMRSFPAINLSGNREPVVAPSTRPGMTIIRRRTKIADVARIVLPPRRDDTVSNRPSVPTAPKPEVEAAPAAEEAPSSSAVVPPSFPVVIPTGSVLQSEAAATEMKPVEEVPAKPTVVETPVESEAPQKPATEPAAEVSTPSPIAETSEAEAPEPEAAPVQETPRAESTLPAPVQETPRAESTLPAPAPADTREKREFVLSNGERIFGHILSETPEAIYIDHGTLGVLTISRAQIAQRPVEIILINGDRIVGDIIAETADSLFVRHASLGILTVPRNQRSTRVVEAILKDGDRILGEVLGETENFTVIRSATLGTVAVPHNRVAMLNRRAEEVQMKALPSSLEDKPAN